MVWIDPNTSPDAWDQALIAGVPCLGLSTITGGDYELGWDIKQGTGKSNATTIATGKKLTECVLRLTFADGCQGLSAEDQLLWYTDQLVPLLMESESAKKALDFYHPQVSEPPISLTSVVVKKITPVQISEDGLRWVDISLLQYRKPKAVGVGKPNGSASKTPSQPTAQSEQDRRLEEATEGFLDAYNG